MPSETALALDAFFEPRSVAVIGATEAPGSIGLTLLTNLAATPFGGTVYPVNPKRPTVLGVKAYPRIADVPGKIDLAIVATPAATVPGIIAECAEAGVKGAIIISAGFREVGETGAALEREVLQRRGSMRIIGPNCMGVMSPFTGLNATLAGAMASPGPVAFISQSGALGAAVLDWSRRELVGFSAFVSVGSMIDVGWGDLIQRLGDDPIPRASSSTWSPSVTPVRFSRPRGRSRSASRSSPSSPADPKQRRARQPRIPELWWERTKCSKRRSGAVACCA